MNAIQVNNQRGMKCELKVMTGSKHFVGKREMLPKQINLPSEDNGGANTAVISKDALGFDGKGQVVPLSTATNEYGANL